MGFFAISELTLLLTQLQGAEGCPRAQNLGGCRSGVFCNLSGDTPTAAVRRCYGVPLPSKRVAGAVAMFLQSEW